MKTKEQWAKDKVQCINNWITELALANGRIDEINHKVHEMEVEKENLEDYVRVESIEDEKRDIQRLTNHVSGKLKELGG